MPLYTYTKYPGPKKRRITPILSAMCMFLGTSILLWILYPILAFEFVYAAKFETLMRPVPQDEVKQTFRTQFGTLLGTSDTDYTKASVWFPQAVPSLYANSSDAYTLSIPKLGIDHADVRIGSDDLDKSLIHFTGAMPGNRGNPVIFGHSTIPWLYNPTNYKSIFTKLIDLDEGDQIMITSDNVTYRYAVMSMKVVKPNDVSVLEQYTDDSYITLVTCVPAGTYLNRLVVKGKLIRI